MSIKLKYDFGEERKMTLLWASDNIVFHQSFKVLPLYSAQCCVLIFIKKTM